ncbi:MAG: hypothetical protein WC266_01410 [Patescibacteria group bacterium]
MSQRMFLIMLLVVVVAYASAPFVGGMLRAENDEYFTGIHSFAVGDINVYYGYLNQAHDGAFLFRDVFTTETTDAIIVNPLWVFLGRIGGVLQLSVAWTFHILRLLSGAALVFLLWKFAQYFFKEYVGQRIATLLLVFGAGVGAFAILFAPSAFIDPYTRPMDLWVSEAFTFFSILHSPHFIIGTGLLVGALWLMIRACERGFWRDSIFSGVILFFLFAFHPFHVPTLGLILIVTLAGEFFLRRLSIRRLFLLALPLIIAAPAAAYHIIATLTDTFSQLRADQNINLIPPVIPTLLSYGLLLPLAVIGAAYWLRRSFRYRFIVWWAAGHMAVLFAPLFFNRRLSQGLVIPLAMLATAGIIVLVDWWKKRNPNRSPRTLFISWGVAGLILFCLSPLYVLGQDLSLIIGRTNYEQIFYRPITERDAYEAFRDMSEPTDRFLSGTLTGNFVAAQTGRHAFIGHTVETLSFDTKVVRVKRFFDEDTPEIRAAFLAQEDIQWIILRVEEFSYAHIPETTPGVTEVFANAAARIYSVDAAGGI